MSGPAALPATATALYRFIGPSALMAVAGRIDPVNTIGLGVSTVIATKNDVSSIVSVPWVTTMPSNPAECSSSSSRLASFSQAASFMS